MDFLKNVFVSLSATGPAAVLAVLIASVTALGIWGEGPIADRAMTVLYFVGTSFLGLMMAQGWHRD